jgi:tetratricopeptide (TPR) repeat protein
MENLRFQIFTVYLIGKVSWSFFRMFIIVILGFLFAFSPPLALVVWGAIIFLFIWKYTGILGQHRSLDPNTQAITQQIQFWETEREKQPTARDILLNLAKLYTAQGNQTQAEKYLQQAREVDPNFSL